LSSLPVDATELSIRTRVVQSLPQMQSSQLKSVVHVVKSRYLTFPW
jgi:pre-mRNA-splicing factor RBM22/SLT11